MKSPPTENNFRLLRNAYQNVSGEIEQIMGSILFSIYQNFIIGPRGLHIMLGKLLKIQLKLYSNWHGDFNVAHVDFYSFP